MSEWTDVTLGDVLTLQRGFDLPQRNRKPGPYPIVSSAGFTGLHDEFKVEPPGVVIGRYGSLGSVHWVVDPFWPLNTALWVKDFKGNDPRFVSYLLETITVDGSSASAVPGVNRNHLHKQSVRMPPVRLQRRIVTLISALDELIAINERRIALLEDLTRSVYREWFVSSRSPGHEAEGSGTTLLPEGWERCRLRDVVTTQYGITASASEGPEGPHLLRGKDINKSSFIRWDQVPFCEITDRDTEKYRLEIGDICVIRMADPGKVGIVERDVEAVFGSYLVRVCSIDSRLPPYLLFYFLDSQEYQDWVSGSSTGSTRKSASAAVLTEPRICLPPLELSMQFERVASTLRRLLSALVEESAGLAHIRELLLPRLVTGQLDISDVDLGVLTPDDPE